jgi:hypothetical protein
MSFPCDTCISYAICNSRMTNITLFGIESCEIIYKYYKKRARKEKRRIYDYLDDFYTNLDRVFEKVGKVVDRPVEDKS